MLSPCITKYTYIQRLVMNVRLYSLATAKKIPLAHTKRLTMHFKFY
jgi:hypothetical protein